MAFRKVMASLPDDQKARIENARHKASEQIKIGGVRITQTPEGYSLPADSHVAEFVSLCCEFTGFDAGTALFAAMDEGLRQWAKFADDHGITMDEARAIMFRAEDEL